MYRGGAGGGGGGFGSDGADGDDGDNNAKGALTDTSPPVGGSPGPAVFQDGAATNDFFGVRQGYDSLGMPNGLFESGELVRPRGGQGGGAGGDAIKGSGFPDDSAWKQNEQGAGGGAGGGVVIIRALGTIQIGSSGRISADGGAGAKGSRPQNGGFQIIGGCSGGGSGGMLVLESATGITNDDLVTALGGPPAGAKPVSTVGLHIKRRVRRRHDADGPHGELYR